MVIRKVNLLFSIISTVLFIGCGMGSELLGEGNPPPESPAPKITKVRVNVNKPFTSSKQKIHSKSMMSPVPTQVKSVTLDVKKPDCNSALVYTSTVDVNTVTYEAPTFNFELESGSTGCLTAKAYSGIEGTGILLFQGSVSDIELPANQSINVSISLGLVGITLPTVSTIAPSNVTLLSAIFEGSVNPNGFETAVYFEWGLTTGYGSATPVQQIESGTANISVNQFVNGLTHTTYHYRIVAYNSGNMVYGSDQRFNTVTKLTWEPPTTNADGTALDNLSGYKIYYGTSSGNYSNSIDIGNLTTYEIDSLLLDSLLPGTYYFAVTAYDIYGNESDYSNEVSIIH